MILYCDINIIVISPRFALEMNRDHSLIFEVAPKYCISFVDYEGSIQYAKTRPRADCGSDHELLIAMFRLKLKKVGEIPSPFRYDLNQIPYDYTVEVTNRFNRLDLIECLKNCGQRFVTFYRRQ